MKPILLLILALFIASGFGRTLLSRMKGSVATGLELFVYSAALGLGVAAYGVYFLGLVGRLAFWPVTLWWLILGIVGLPGTFANLRDLALSVHIGNRRFSPAQAFIIFSGLFLCVFGVITLLACFKPPGAFEWDALAYHLADPKIFLADHRITSLRTEHHSNFPFTMEMLFTVGLLYDGYALANLFHFLMAALTVLAMLAFCRKLLNPLVGWCAALLFVSTPLVLWEAGVAYIDLGLALYVTLATFAVIQAIHPAPIQPSSDPLSPDDPDLKQKHWILLAGIMIGFALGMKYLSLLPFGLLGLLLYVRLRSLRLLGTYAAVALVIASPWYLKNIIITHNPVYPYFFRFFPQSRDWSADRAKDYESEQGQFGYPHSLKAPGETLLGLFTSPWNLLVNGQKYANGGEYSFMTLIGGLYAALNLGIAFQRRIPRLVKDLLWIGVAQLVAWYFLAQVVRYVIAFLPLFAVTGGCAASSFASRKPQLESDPERRKGVVGGALPLLVVAGQALLTLWAVFVLPTTARGMQETGMMPTALSVPQVLTVFTEPNGAEELLSHHNTEIYSGMNWLNKNTPNDAGVVLYDETRGFYLDRPYLWGNAEHSGYIPYDKFTTGQELTDWMLQHNYRYALINMKYNRRARLGDPNLPTGPAGNEVLALQLWYAEARFSEDPPWRLVLADALRRGQWVVEHASNGVVVLRIGAEKQGRSVAPSFLAGSKRP